MEKGRAYEMLGIVATNHETYGKGQQATIETFEKKRMRVQLPGKYLLLFLIKTLIS